MQQADRFGTFYNDVEKKMFTIIANANDFDAGLGPDCEINVTTKRCATECGP